MTEILDVKTLPWAVSVTFIDTATNAKFETLGNGLILVNEDIGNPDTRTHGVAVPGKDGKLDLTEALGGFVFENRTISLEFRVIEHTTTRFHATASKLRNAINGRKMKIILGDDPGYYWIGRCSVDASHIGRSVSTVEVKMDAEPFKRSVVSSYDPWEWDRFSFVDGVVTQPKDVVLTGSMKSVALPLDPARGRVVLWLNTGSAQARLSTDATWHALASGANSMPEIRMSDTATSTLYLTGTGTVGVEYRVGSL
jgi:hypothetical protein